MIWIENFALEMMTFLPKNLASPSMFLPHTSSRGAKSPYLSNHPDFSCLFLHSCKRCDISPFKVSPKAMTLVLLTCHFHRNKSHFFLLALQLKFPLQFLLGTAGYRPLSDGFSFWPWQVVNGAIFPAVAGGGRVGRRITFPVFTVRFRGLICKYSVAYSAERFCLK